MQLGAFCRWGIEDCIIRCVRFHSLPSVTSWGAIFTCGFGANNAELAVDDTEIEFTIIARRISPATGAGGGAGAETGVGGPVPVDGPIL